MLRSTSPLDTSERLDEVPAAEREALLRRARLLQRVHARGKLQLALRGRHLALFCDDETSAEAALFRGAAEELGARVAHVRPGLNAHSDAAEIEHTALMLGRLYVAIECQGVHPRLVRQIRLFAGVPVYLGVASDNHPSARLVTALAGTPALDARRWLLQAVLIGALG